MKQRNEEKKGKLRQELITVRHSKKNEGSRQVIRKTLSPSSRFLDNYFNSGMHINSWLPNGKVIEKKKYTYGDTGLSHLYTKNNVLQKKDINEKQANKISNAPKNFLEYDYLEEGDYLITIEHCSNCLEHLTHTQHINDIYLKFAKTLQRCILLRFPYMKVYLKPIETDIISKEAALKENRKTNIIDNMYKEVRIGAMEIQLGFMNKNKKEVHIIHSKLSSGHWPSISNVLNKLVSFVPTCNLAVKIYDKEEGINQEETTGEDLLFSKYENVKVNLNLISHPQLKELCDYINEELENILNPKKRKEILKLQNKVENSSKEFRESRDMTNIYKPNSSRIDSAGTINIRNTSMRPYTGRSQGHSRILSPGMRNSNYTNFTQQYYSNNSSSFSHTRPFSTTGSRLHPKNISMNGSRTSYVSKLPESIEDNEIISSLKGSLLCSKFTDKNGLLNFANLPLDCYLIEVEDSRNFLTSAAVVKFNKIPEAENKNDKSESSLPTLNKFLGLRRQTQSYLEIYIYHNNDANEFLNLQNVSGSEVTIRRCTEQTGDNFFEDEGEIPVKENKKIKGRHEIIATPGKYFLEVKKSGYEPAIKDVELICGENKINVELFKEKKSKFGVLVFDAKSKTPLENVTLKIVKNKNEESGLTDPSGLFSYDSVSNGDCLSVYASKDGYFPCQRTFIKEIAEINMVNFSQSKGTIEKDFKIGPDGASHIIIFLVSESYIREQGRVMLVLYSSLQEDNFDNCCLVSDEIKELVNIYVENYQSNKGALLIEINKKDNFKEYPFEYENEHEEFPEIIRLVFRIKNNKLLQHYDANKKANINGLQKYSSEVCLYCPNGLTFFLNAPQYSRETTYSFWDLGFLDIRSNYLYETGVLINNLFPKNLFFSDWLHFLQIVIDQKVFTNLFEFLSFNKGFLNQNDRLLYEAAFIRALKALSPQMENFLSVDFLIYLCDLMKNNAKLISFLIFKKKLTSNLKNFNI